MILLQSLDQLAAACDGGTSITIGVFDAVHRGHQMLIKRARDEARMRAVSSLVFTFERHPLALLAPVHCPPAITQPGEKARLIEQLDVDACLILPFTREVAGIPAEEFIRDILVRRCGVRFITCGWNFSFGAGGKGTTQMLKSMGEELGFDVEIFDPMIQGHSPISSTGVRNLLIEGDVAEAVEMLGRRYGFSAEVVTGDRRGRTIGYPTANLRPGENQLIPAEGVYAVAVAAGSGVQGGLKNGEATLGGMMNIGRRPTFAGAGPSIEVHIFDFDRDIVGQSIRVEFIKRIRDEIKFDGVEQLVAQLGRDEATCREICAMA